MGLFVKIDIFKFKDDFIFFIVIRMKLDIDFYI